MPRKSKIYTRTGDVGTTGLGSGRRVSKAVLRVEAYGSVDELNAHVGVVLALGATAELTGPLHDIQTGLFELGAELSNPGSETSARPGPRIGSAHVQALERVLDTLDQPLEPLKNFILPGGCPVAAQLHLSRTVCRRAECTIVALSEQEAVRPEVLAYVNRLSDLFFVMARVQNKASGVAEEVWRGRT
ncbi:MAG: cob(I)yrinic acid a,c-diamide adenosyltransferase [Planctomycetes bacterium]|nr:cob(I)yrinic acid a,c-diamide adenosyltransferase [Planctomycetota bacterium]